MRKAWWLVIVVMVVAVLVAGLGCRSATPTPTSGGASSAPRTITLKAYIPCGMIIPMRAVMAAFEAKHPDIKVNGVFDNPGIIVERLTKKGEKGDVIVTSGRVEMAALKAAGKLAGADPVALGDFELVVIVPANSKLDIKQPADLKRCKTISSASAETNSTGVSGKEALTKLGLWADLQPKFVYTKHAIEAYTMVAGGKADAAISYKNCPLDTNPEKLAKSKVRVAFSFPPDSYQKQTCLIAALKDAKADPAQAFIDFVSSKEGRQILEAKGMTGCLNMGTAGSACATAPAAAPAKTATQATAAAGKPLVTVVAYYPDNESHAALKKLVLDLPAKFGKQVKAEFVDFTSDAGFKQWQEAGMTCGGIQINGQQTWTYIKDGKPTEVTFKMAEGGEWTKADLEACVKKALADTSKKQ